MKKKRASAHENKTLTLFAARSFAAITVIAAGLLLSFASPAYAAIGFGQWHGASDRTFGSRGYPYLYKIKDIMLQGYQITADLAFAGEIRFMSGEDYYKGSVCTNMRYSSPIMHFNENFGGRVFCDYEAYNTQSTAAGGGISLSSRCFRVGGILMLSQQATEASQFNISAELSLPLLGWAEVFDENCEIDEDYFYWGIGGTLGFDWQADLFENGGIFLGGECGFSSNYDGGAIVSGLADFFVKIATLGLVDLDDENLLDGENYENYTHSTYWNLKMGMKYRF